MTDSERHMPNEQGQLAPSSSLGIWESALGIPPGRWIVGVSGGADSVGLLRAVRALRPDVSLIVAHLNHEARGAESDADAAFVAALADSLGVEITVARLSDFGPAPTRGHEAAYRAARLKLFRQLASRYAASGVLLAHHAGDRAETTLLRLLRGGEPWALGGLRREAAIDGLRIFRPLLSLPRAAISQYLESIDQPWREDASNATPRFARNRIRRYLEGTPELVEALMALADAADVLRDWTRERSPRLGEVFSADDLGGLPGPLARAAARRWLVERGCPASEVSASVAETLIEMCRDLAIPGRHTFSKNLKVARSKGKIQGK
jgi:tRNA(Ile)-lysidine synthase